MPPKVIVLTLHKGGTHLLHAALAQLTAKPVSQIDFRSLDQISLDPQSIEIFHFYEELEEWKTFLKNHVRLIILIRDPRDAAVSSLYWILKHRLSATGKKPNADWLSEDFDTLPLSQQMEQILFTQNPNSVAHMFCRIPGWFNHPHLFVCRFEDLIGQQGGGSRDRQVATISKLADFLQEPLSEAKTHEIADGLFGHNLIFPVGTFREGKIGSWKEHFSYEQTVRFHARYGREMIQLGYTPMSEPSTRLLP